MNAQSSRSHAVLCVKLSVTAGNKTKTSIASAIDLAGSEDNRRTDNGKERLVESASINKSLFVLAQCVEAIGKKQARIPYRESKMTRILSLGQNNGLTIMILNIAPVRSYHLDTLSSLNFANRTKKIEVKEVENESVLIDCARSRPTATGASLQRQPLRPLASTVHNATVRFTDHSANPSDKLKAKAFSVYSDQPRYPLSNPLTTSRRLEAPKRSSPLKRPSDSLNAAASRANKSARPSPPPPSRCQSNMSKAAIENMVEKKVSEILAARVLEQQLARPVVPISEDVQRRLDLLERRIESHDDGRAEGLSFLLMAKQHHARGEDASALKMYELAREYFPDNSKLEKKILRLQEKLRDKKVAIEKVSSDIGSLAKPVLQQSIATSTFAQQKVSNDPQGDEDYQDGPAGLDNDYECDGGFRYKPKMKKLGAKRYTNEGSSSEDVSQTPRTKQLLDIINTRDVARIRLLKGVGAKKAESIIEALCVGEDNEEDGERLIGSLGQLSSLKGVGSKTVENMRLGLGGVPLDA